jgi:hypothetical protein
MPDSVVTRIEPRPGKCQKSMASAEAIQIGSYPCESVACEERFRGVGVVSIVAMLECAITVGTINGEKPCPANFE